MAKTKSSKYVWLAAMHGGSEVSPALPLHDPSSGWISATYNDGRRTLVDLSTVLKDAHIIKRVELGNSVSTMSLYRILLSIAYDSFDMTVSPRQWQDIWRRELLANEGFSSQWVEAYFSRYQDRFFLIHPHFPFLQDPSLVFTYEKSLVRPTTPEEQSAYRKAFSRKLSGISQVHPGVPSTNREDGEKVTWGIPYDEVYRTDASPGERTGMLMTALLHQRYAHAATNRGVRAFWDKDSGNDTHTTTHSLRCAVGYLVEAGSLYQTLMLSVEYVPHEFLMNDIPEWEQEVNPSTGFLGRAGYSRDYNEVYAGPNAPRSSVNLTQMAMLYVPEFDAESGRQRNEGGQVRQLRRLLFNFKHLKEADGTTKMPFPLSWNPYIAVKPDGKALKQTTAISSKTALSNPNLFRVALLPEREGLVKPLALTRLARDAALDAELARQGEPTIRVFVYAGDAKQEKTFADFTLQTKDMARIFDNDEMVNRLERWIDVGENLRKAVSSQIKYAFSDGKDEKVDLGGPQRVFWSSYYALFSSALQEGEVTPIEAFKSDITQLMLGIFDNATSTVLATNPLRVGQKRGTLIGLVGKQFPRENTGEDSNV